MISFQVTHQSGQARTGVISTPRGDIPTPIYMPVGTMASVKTMSSQDLVQLDAKIILGNTYHLHVRPGEELIQKLGGLHKFMGWERPMLTDSGGFQVYSLGDRMKVTEEGVAFQSYVDGSKRMLTPEKAVAIQEALGSDIMMCLDELPSLPASDARLVESLERTTRWALRCKQSRTGDNALFGIIQGGCNPGLRQTSLGQLLDIGFDGYALGGLSVGEPPEEMYATVQAAAPLLPPEKPRYLMGVGEPQDLLTAVGAGMDMFDCIIPTRKARHGTLYTRRGQISIRQNKFREDPAPPDPQCGCFVCQHYSRAYLRHLAFAHEITGLRLNTYHNLYFYLRLMDQMRQAIREDRFESFSKEFLAQYQAGE
ncbi:MAG: tRNA guanosine(34) transglycosylase Tgt [Deltaproteobacteria bacterium]|nr:tRNA guanosine(34) transglycosylase Tgt [Deltaproteobacteria bacterium]